MSNLTYGSLEEILRVYIKPQITRLDLANILLISPLIGSKAEEREENRRRFCVDSTTVTRVCSGERGLPPRILACYAEPAALTHINTAVALDILPRIHGGSQKALIQDILSVIEQDEMLTSEEKAYFSKLAAQKNPCDFLAEAHMCAVNRKPAAPKVENLPKHNRFFYGREELLVTIERRYQEGVHIQSMFGMGGVGKTQIALQYAHLHSADYATIWWFNAESKASLQSSVSKFLAAKKIVPKGRDTDSVRLAFLNYCTKHSGWLFIYDNAEYGAEEEYETLSDYFPSAPASGDVLLTTRCKNPFENAIHIEIPVFNHEEAVRFLQKRSRLEDQFNAKTVAAQLGFLPLALEYAAAYIRETPGVDYIAYSEKLERYGVKVLDRKIGHQAYKNTVREAFHITLDRLLEDSAVNPISRSTEQFLYICAFLASDGIELDVFSAYGKGLPEPVKTVLENELDRDELTRNLTRYSLVQIDKGAMSIHRLLQEVLRDELDPATGMLCINYAYGVFYSIFYSLRTEPPEKSRQLLTGSVPHVQSILYRYVRQYQDGGRVIPDGIMVAKEYFSWTGMLLIDTKQLEDDELMDACRRNIAILQTAADFYGMMPGHKTIYPAFMLLLLAQAYEQLGNTPAALEQYLSALDISCEAIDILPATMDTEPLNSVQSQYLIEAFQLSADICAAIGSSSIVCYDAKLLWRNFKCLKNLVQKRMLYSSRGADVGGYREAIAYLRLFSNQVADYTQRAFVLRLNAPKNRQGRHLPDGPFGFFFPTDTTAPSVNNLDGFDILLDRGREIAVVMLDRPWTTLGFPADARTAADMLSALVELDAPELSIRGKTALFSMICELAGHLRREDIRNTYAEKLRNTRLLT